MAKALIIDGRVMEVWPAGMTPPIDPAMMPPGGQLIDAPDNVNAGWFYRAGVFKLPHISGLESAPYHANYINAQSAKRELTGSDRVMVRCFEEGAPPDATWKAYRVSLRSIIALENDTTSAPIPLPARPPFPFGGSETAV